jgi:hypothetical protein
MVKTLFSSTTAATNTRCVQPGNKPMNATNQFENARLVEKDGDRMIQVVSVANGNQVIQYWSLDDAIKMASGIARETQPDPIKFVRPSEEVIQAKLNKYQGSKGD